MAYENIQIQQPNFCLGPQLGTICTIDTTNPQTVLKIKNTSGSTILDMSLSSNIVSDTARVEYVGPPNLTSVQDGLTFFTFEKVTDSSCLLKRWETRVSSSELLLKEQVVKSTTGNERYNAIDFAVEYYYRQFSQQNEAYLYLDMNSVVNVKNGTKLFLGPSTDSDNLGATEVVTVSHIIDYIGGKRVYLTSTLNYQYAEGDPITFYSHIYIFSSEGYAGDIEKGTLFKIDAYNWQTKEIDTKNIYKNITASRWCPTVGAIASIVNTNMLFVRPYDSYLNWRSMFLNNVKSDKNTVIPVYDVIFNGNNIYKLQDAINLREDNGDLQTYNWATYNYHQDTLLPYTNSIVTYMEQSIIPYYYEGNKNVDIHTQVRDQFHVGLRDLEVNFYIESGDTEVVLDPLNGAVITDTNGEAVINYTSGAHYEGHTLITTRVANSSSYTGSQYVWTSNNVITVDVENNCSLKQKNIGIDSIGGLRQLNEYFKIYYEDPATHEVSVIDPYSRIKCKSFFMTPGGDWGNIIDDVQAPYFSISVVEQWLPELYLGSKQTDAPFDGGDNTTGGYGFTNWPYELAFDDKVLLIANQIKLVDAFESEVNTKSITEYLVYNSEIGHAPYVLVYQPDESGELQISQLKLSLHTYWVDGDPYDYLWTKVNLDQFVFVEDAVPKFYSEKNPVDTDVWIRLRPFAFSLDISTFRMWVRVNSSEGDSGYYEISSSVNLSTFDAGGGVLGIEALYNPPEDFPHNSMVFIRIEVYDEAAIPNFIYVDYWFKVIPDYKAPYLINLSPDREDINIAVDSPIYLEIKDDGSRLDLDSIECLINSRLFDPDYTVIEAISNSHVKITYTPQNDLYFGKDYKITVKAQDSSPNANAMNDAYTFYTAESSEVDITNPVPGV